VLIGVAEKPAPAASTESDDFEWEVDWEAVGDVLDQLGPGVGELVRQPSQRQKDIVESLLRSHHHAHVVAEEFGDEIKNHWDEIVALTSTLLAAEVAVAMLAAIPDPTFATRIAAIVLQAIILAFAIEP
jgi:hypothetical protein